MSLSIMQEIFVLLEDEKEVPFFRLKRWGRPARGSLAKLKSLGWAEKIEKDNEIFYKITEQGEKYFDEVLSVLKNKGVWDKKWRLALFEIPETNRALRDKLRRQLSGLGLGLLQAGVWISPEDIEEKIGNIGKDLSLGNQLKFFVVSATPSLNEQIIEKSWNIPSINDELQSFTKDAIWALKAMGKGNGDHYNAKKMIFEYALILKKSPSLPNEFLEHNEIRKKANEAYLKLRKFAV
jgi:phenylacetic acid degradation operon negative regulatory protein